ncbi:MAG TPA: hypothetical protein VN921_01400 [Chthoniobacterales bacterium]|nr:hypothetical protein [Chthoniobacterales bacterium]
MANPDVPTGSQRFARLINEQQRADLDWMVDTIKPITVTLNGQQMFKHTTTAALLLGYMSAIAVEHQDWTFWQVLTEAHRKFVVKLVAPS